MSSIVLTSRGLLGHSDMYRWLRRNLSVIAAGIIFFTIGIEHELIASCFSDKGWKLDSYYSAIFNWSAFQGAFLFSVYAFFLSRSEPFIKAVAATQPFRELRQYVLRALWLSMLLSLASLPAIVIAPPIKVGSLMDPGFIVFWCLTTALAFTFGCFVKVVRVFRLLEGMEGN